jgi:hypothetical protein
MVSNLFEEGVKSGVVKALKTNVFEATEVEQAFRFMARYSEVVISFHSFLKLSFYF